MSRFLLIHQNFPGQFKHLAPALAARGHEVRALHLREELPVRWRGVDLHHYRLAGRPAQGLHPWLVDLETKLLRGQACLAAMCGLAGQGFVPDVVLAHPGWGESLFVKDVWPQTRLLLYAEFFYRAQGADVGFDPEFATVDGPLASARLRLKNANHLLQLEAADALLSPTRWQASTFPASCQGRMQVVHDGIDTLALQPQAQASLTLPNGQVLRRGDPVVTFVSRNLEPYRGYHTFVRSLPTLLRAQPAAQVLIIGGDGVSYGTPAPDGQSWKTVFAEEVRPQLGPQEWARVHFLGRVPYAQYLTVMRVSAVHVYLTYPFVLSWSLLEAMSLECAIVASDTAPVREVITDGHQGILVDFFDASALAERIGHMLDHPAERTRLGQAARAAVVKDYDLHQMCLPRQLSWLEAGGR